MFSKKDSEKVERIPRRMSVLTADFLVEGSKYDPSMVQDGKMDVTEVLVTMTTDGTFVRLESLGRFNIPLTALGWAQVAMHAKEVIEQANVTWDKLGSER